MLTPEGKAWLIAHYPVYGGKWCAAQMGWKMPNITKWAHKHGLRVDRSTPEWRQSSARSNYRQGYKAPKIAAALQRKMAEGTWHPPKLNEEQKKRAGATYKQGVRDGRIIPSKPGLGKHPTEESRAKMRASHQALVVAGKHPGQRPRGAAQRQKHSAHMSARLTSGGNVYSRCKHGKREDLGGQYFRSSWEANYARFLNLLIRQGQIKSWEFEPETFWFEKIRRGVRSYTPDFKVMEPNGAVYYVEVKGWMDAKSQTKLKRMKRYHPSVDLRLVGQKAYMEISRKLGGAIPHWESAA